MKKSRKKHLTLQNILFVFGIINLLAIDLWFIFKATGFNQNVLGESSSACPQACLSYINRISTSSSSSSGEYFVPLGTGTNQSDDWADVTGAQAYIDSTRYRRIKKVTFEATLEVPASSQISYVRLYNVTDKHPVWYSELSMDGSGPQLLASSPVTLDSGQKLYQVQMKSQLKALTRLVQSRVHILTY
jgi:hypothetical protein